MRTVSPRRRAPSTMPPERRVADRIGDQVAQDSLEQHGIRVDGEPRRHGAQRETARACLRREVGREPGEQRFQRYGDPRGMQRPGFEPRKVDELGEQALQRLQRRMDARDQRPDLGIARLCGEGRGEEAHRVQRLAEIVARGGEELALRPVGGFRGGARRERGVGLRLELADQVDVLVAHRQRLRQHVVQLVPERQHEHEHDAQHQRGEQVRLVALGRDARR